MNRLDPVHTRAQARAQANAAIADTLAARSRAPDAWISSATATGPEDHG